MAESPTESRRSTVVRLPHSVHSVGEQQPQLTRKHHQTVLGASLQQAIPQGKASFPEGSRQWTAMAAGARHILRRAQAGSGISRYTGQLGNLGGSGELVGGHCAHNLHCN